MNYSNGRMWDEYDKAMSRITGLEEELEKANARAEAAEAQVAALQAELIRAIDIYKDPAVAHANILNGRIVLPKFYVNITDDFGPVADLRAALDAAINMNIEKNAEVVRLTAALAAANDALKFAQSYWMQAIAERDAANEDAAFHPRAAKLMHKRKNFIVIACDEAYFMDVYDLIRDSEMQKGTWTIEDQWHYDDAKVAHRARVGGGS